MEGITIGGVVATLIVFGAIVYIAKNPQKVKDFFKRDKKKGSGSKGGGTVGREENK